MNSNDTIVAPATPFGFGGISVIRLSGPYTEKILASLSATDDNTPTCFVPRHATLCTLIDQGGKSFETAIITYFKAPFSYTGEEAAEISCHGNPVLVQRIVDICCFQGARIAQPGEFTQRAFLSGKIDLIQAESVAALIHSQSRESSLLNYKLLSGELSERIQSLKRDLVSALSLVEFELDISEEELQKNLRSDLLGILEPLATEIGTLLLSYKQGRLLTEGALVVIIGEPNVGKSTLLNALSESDRAITGHRPGTTRDPIDISLFVEGVPIKLVDTAGLRESKRLVEQEGVKRSRSYAARADMLLALHTAGTELKNNIPEIIDKPIINIFNKCDRVSAVELRQLKQQNPNCLFISATQETGLEKLKSSIKEQLGISAALSESVALTTSRQHSAFKNCRAGLSKAREHLKAHAPVSYEIVALELREALNSLDEILGKTTPDDILNNIFSTFCIGK